jgi:hypothetical protein
MAQYLYQTRLSDHLALTPEDYLIATGCVLCRSGPQQYLVSELDESSNSDEPVTVNRPVEEVTAPTFLASLPGKSFVVNHPSSGLITSDTHSWSTRGTVLRAYISDKRDDDGNVLILGDIAIHDPTAIQRVLNGQRQLSVGYKYELEQGADGGLSMKNLIANHVALCDFGRAGNAMIMDNAVEKMLRENVKPEDEDDEDQIPMAKTKMATDEEQSARIDRLCSLLEQLLSRKAADDALVPVATLPKSERPENPIVDDLRRLRATVTQCGDKGAIDAYNAAMIAAKAGNAQPAEQFISAYDSAIGAGAPSFGEMVSKRGRELMDGKLPSEGTEYSTIPRERAALDSRGKTESYEELLARVGKQMRSQKFQRS